MLDENQPADGENQTDEPTAPEAPVAEASETVETPEEPETPTEPVAAPATTTVTTTTRRTAAGRPAGPPTVGLFSAPIENPLAAPETAPATPVAKAKPGLMFQAPPEGLAPALPKPEPVREQQKQTDDTQDTQSDADSDSDVELGEDGEPKRRRRSRGGRRRRKNEDGDDSDNTDSAEGDSDNSGNDDSSDDNEEGAGGTRRRRRRARAGEDTAPSADDPENTVVKVREGRTAEDEITGVSGSTRLEAKKQRRREGREAGRRRAPIVSEAEFLARRESVDREMVVRQGKDFTQIAVLEDKVLVEHYVARESQTSLIGNVYVGKVQNVLPSMEAAWVHDDAGSLFCSCPVGQE